MLQYSPKITTDGLVMCLDASNNKSYPTDLPVKNGLALWLDAADDSTFSYSSGTSVSQWRDKSGNNRHFFQATAGNQPSRSSVINSRKTVQFTAASSQYLRYNNTIINNTTAGSVFFVWRTAGETQGYANLLDNYHGGYNALSAGFSIERNNVSDQLYWGFYSSGSTQAGTTGLVSYLNNTSYMYYITKDSTNITAKANGYSVATNASPSATWVEDTKGWLIGCWGSNTETFSRFYNGQIAEIIIFSKGLSDLEAKQVTNYLSLKWNTENIVRSIFDLAGSNDNGLLGNGTVENMPLYDYYNKGSFKFDGSNDYISIPYNSGLVPNTLTLSAWINRTAAVYYAHFIGVPVSDTTWASPYVSYGIEYIGTTDTIGLVTGYTDNNFDYTSATAFGNDTWFHFTATYDKTNVKIYINGILQTTRAETRTLYASTANFYIGSNNTTSEYPLNGKIANTLLYSRALSAAEVSQNYEAQKSKFANTIVQQGLVLNLDAGNPYSYAGAGTTWYDVSSIGNNSTLSNGPVYSPDIGGNIVFDGSDDFTDVTLSSLTTTVTLEFWVKYTNLTNNMIFGFASYDIYALSGALGFNTANSDVYGLTSTQVSGLNIAGNWNHIVFVMRSDISYTNNKIYVNGVNQSLSQVLSSEASGNRTFNSGNGRISGWKTDTSYKIPGSIASFRAYNIELSAAQVLQNYNATKGRFGL